MPERIAKEVWNGIRPSDKPWDKLSQLERTAFVMNINATIRAMRVPTQQQVMAALNKRLGQTYSPSSVIWQAMIDELLKEV